MGSVSPFPLRMSAIGSQPVAIVSFGSEVRRGSLNLNICVDPRVSLLNWDDNLNFVKTRKLIVWVIEIWVGSTIFNA